MRQAVVRLGGSKSFAGMATTGLLTDQRVRVRIDTTSRPSAAKVYQLHAASGADDAPTIRHRALMRHQAR